MEHDGTVENYEPVPVPLAGKRAAVAGARPSVVPGPRARPSRRAAVYVHCLGDPFVAADIVDWYTNRGFHFYAADLREVGAEGRGGNEAKAAAEDLSECFACLDAAVAHLRGADSIDTVVVCAHGNGALIAALWCHARRGSRPVDALVLASPNLGTRSPRLPRPWPARDGSGPAARRAGPLVARAQRRLLRGLDIACPVLVMSPAKGGDVPGGPAGLLTRRAFAAGHATLRLGEHVTWLNLDEGRPGPQIPDGPERGRLFDE